VHSAAVAVLIGISPDENSDFRLDRLREQSARPVAKNLVERIGEGLLLSQLDEASVGDGASILRWRSGGVEHSPSPTPAHSS
jgi:hypothetical protein